MTVVISGDARSRFRTALLAHRARSTMTDADYVKSSIRVSLNTWKRCVGGDATLTLKPQTFRLITRQAGLDPALFVAVAGFDDQTGVYGSYTRSDWGFLERRYLLHRRSFLTAENITRGVLDIEWDDQSSCLKFCEMIRYVSDGGVPQAVDTSGFIYMHAEQMLMTLLAVRDGEVRMTLLHTPSKRPQKTNLGPIRSAGVLLTHGYPKRVHQPVVSVVTIEELTKAQRNWKPERLSRTIRPADPEFEPMARELTLAEEHACVLTPLLWRARKSEARG